MKQIITLLSALILMVQVHVKASELFLKIYRAGNYRVQIGNQVIYNPGNTFRFFDLNPGFQQIIISDAVSNMEYYRINLNLTNGYRTVCELDVFGRVNTIAQVAVNYMNWYQEAPSYNMPGNGYPGNYWPPNTQNPQNPYNPYPPGNPYPPNNGGGNSGGGFYGMDQNSYQQLKNYISRLSFDSEKLSQAKSSLAQNRMSAEQVAGIASLFDWDSYRLDYAKAAYDYCIDQQNYFKVSSTFSWTSYADDLQKYIATKG